MYLAGPGKRCSRSPKAEAGSVRDDAGAFYPSMPNPALLRPCRPFPASCSPGRQSQPTRVVLGIVRLSVRCPCLAAVPFSCPLLGNSPRATSRQPRLPFWPQPARMIRSFDSSYLNFCSRGVGLGSAAKIKPVTGHGKALGSFPVQNNKRRVCPASAPSPVMCFVGCWLEQALPAVKAD